MSVQGTLSIDYSFASCTIFRGFFNPLLIALPVDEMKGIRGPQLGVKLSVLSLVEKHFEAIVRPQFEVMVTLGTD